MKLKRMDRFELLELIYDMRKANLELTQRCEDAEKRIEELKAEADQRVEQVRAEYVQRIDELRMQGSAKELQKRMSMIEEQLLSFQRMTGRQSAEESALPASVLAPAPSSDEAAQAASPLPGSEGKAAPAPDGEGEAAAAGEDEE